MLTLFTAYHPYAKTMMKAKLKTTVDVFMLSSVHFSVLVAKGTLVICHGFPLSDQPSEMHLAWES